MQTEYTYKLMGNGQSFNDFVMGCARAMEECITLRDEPSYTGITRQFKPDKSYAKYLKEKEALLAKLLIVKNKQSPEDYAILQLDSAIGRVKKFGASNIIEDARVDDMIRLVKAWLPPTSDHQELKQFMLKQLSTSRHSTNDYCEKEIGVLENLKNSPQNYFELLIIEAKVDVRGAQAGLEGETDRCKSRNAWIKALQESL